jgi:acyl-CoA thioester hydrolase
MVARGVDAVVAEANLDFRSPARFDDLLELRAQIARLGRTAITTEIDVVRGEELLLAGRLRHVCVDTRSLSDSGLPPGKIEIPDWVRSGLRRYAPRGVGQDRKGNR